MAKDFISGLAGFTALTVLWVYLFSLLNIGFSDSFNFFAWGRALNANFILTLIVMGLAVAGAIFVLIYYSSRLKNLDLVVISVVGSIITLIVGVVLSLFSSLWIFTFFIMFYCLGCIYLSYRDYTVGKSGLSKAKFGWGASKRIFLMLSMAGLLGGIIFTYIDLPTYQGKIKGSLLNFTSSINIGDIVTREDVRQLAEGQELSKDEIETLVTEQYQQLDWFNALSSAQQNQLIENATNQAYDAQINNREEVIDKMYEFFKSRSVALPSITGNIIDRIPIMKAMLDLIPIFAGLLLMSAITMFGQLFVGPFLAILGLGLKEKSPPPVSK